MDDLECPLCGNEVRSLRCSGCNTYFPPVFGVPFVGIFEPEDMLGLIEIAANAPNRGKFNVNLDLVDRLEELCQGYAEATDKAEFLELNEEARAPYFLNRYHEWEEVNALTEGMNLAGMKVLDIGAGLGFDSARLWRKGAIVTALEFSPLLIEAGAKSVPGVRWIGGLSHALPFKSKSFDAIFINAALHHMRDLPTVISEALRVLRVGGTLITTCDSFRADNSPPEAELSIFDGDEAVLLGVNEQVPCFREFTDTLTRHRDALSVDIYTHLLYGGIDGNSPDLTSLHKWSLDDAPILRLRAGSIAMMVKVNDDLDIQRATINTPALEASVYSKELDDQARAVSMLSGMMPRKFVNRSLHKSPIKFDLLNGWRLPIRGSLSRRAFKRGRLFLSRTLSNSVEVTLRSSAPADFEFIVEGKHLTTERIGNDMRTIALDIRHVPPRKVFALEVRRAADGGTFEANHFDVASVRLSNRLDQFVPPRTASIIRK